MDMNGMKLVLSAVFSVIAANAAFSEDSTWGDLRGQFTFNGKPPKSKTIAVTKDSDALGDNVSDESLEVNPSNLGIANILIYLLPKEGEKLHVHASYEKSANDKVELSMHEGRFQPHVILLRTTQTLVQKNCDSIAHNAHISFLSNAPM